MLDKNATVTRMSTSVKFPCLPWVASIKWRLHKQLYPQPEGTVPRWMDSCGVIRSPIKEPGRSGKAVKIEALSKEPGNTGWTTAPVRNYLLMGDLDNIQLQPIMQDIVNETVVPPGDDNQMNLENKRERIKNDREWRVMSKNTESLSRPERLKGRNIIKCITSRWDMEFPELKRAAQNLSDNAKRSKKGWGIITEQ